MAVLRGTAPVPADAGMGVFLPECFPRNSAFSVAARITFSAASGVYSAMEAKPNVP